ncbi:cAMP phosphodiesterases class-II-domain-containing protein [Russula aff. rugulosa BPL654]|nr:cAMP phosphodiesterases class-II-domain-containing protein [Russula aff. rugulosa BPL654]
MPTFDFVVVGSGGGPYETNLSSYLFKTCDTSWKDGIIALEAGSGMGTLQQLLNKDNTLFDGMTAHQVYSFIHCFIISHAHLDHVNGLILSAGSLSGSRKRVCASLSTLKTLETIFADRIWPNLASWDADDAAYKLLYDPLNFNEGYKTIFPDVSVKAMPVSHGKNDTLGDYESTAFFIRHDPTCQEFLFFGDVSPDSLCESESSEPQMIAVWRAAAPKIPSKLSTIFIECSWPSGRSDEQLYGHLSPEHLVDELAALAAEVVGVRNAAAASSTAKSNGPKRKKRKRRHSEPLAGLRIYIIHCKDDLEHKFSRPISHVIRDQVEELVRAKGLGAEILSAEQGMTIGMCCGHFFFFFESVALIRVSRSYLVSPFTSFTDGLYSWFRCTAFVYNK